MQIRRKHHTISFRCNAIYTDICDSAAAARRRTPVNATRQRQSPRRLFTCRLRCAPQFAKSDIFASALAVFAMRCVSVVRRARNCGCGSGQSAPIYGAFCLREKMTATHDYLFTQVHTRARTHMRSQSRTHIRTFRMMHDPQSRRW